jgi:hypothetical protein
MLHRTTYALGLLDSDAHNTRNWLQAELGESLASLLLSTALLGSSILLSTGDGSGGSGGVIGCGGGGGGGGVLSWGILDGYFGLGVGCHFD